MIKETFKDNLNIWETFLHFNFAGGLQQIGIASHCSRKCAFLICKKNTLKMSVIDFIVVELMLQGCSFTKNEFFHNF